MVSNRMRTVLSLALCLFCLCSLAQQVEHRTHVIISTDKGDITVSLYNDTPLHRDNFIQLCQEHFYDSLLFHRVISDFMIQGGDPQSRHARMDKELGDGGPGYELPAEIFYPKHFHKRGALAAAREGDATNPERKSSGSQFYIVWGKRYGKSELKEMVEAMREEVKGYPQMPDSVRQTYLKIGGCPHLDAQYTVFGEVSAGLDVVKRIQNVATEDNDRPFDDIKILSTKVVP